MLDSDSCSLYRFRTLAFDPIRLPDAASPHDALLTRVLRAARRRITRRMRRTENEHELRPSRFATPVDRRFARPSRSETRRANARTASCRRLLAASARALSLIPRFICTTYARATLAGFFRFRHPMSVDFALRLLAAFACVAIGLERQLRQRTAGLPTITLVNERRVPVRHAWYADGQRRRGRYADRGVCGVGRRVSRQWYDYTRQGFDSGHQYGPRRCDARRPSACCAARDITDRRSRERASCSSPIRCCAS